MTQNVSYYAGLPVRVDVIQTPSLALSHHGHHFSGKRN